MNSFGTLLSGFLLMASSGMSQNAAPQTRQVAGVVETLDGKRLPHVTIRMTNVGGTTTTDSGEFTFSLTPNVLPGQSIELSLAGDWVISSPWEGRTFVPLPGTDPLHVRVAHRGDARLLADPDVVEKIVVGVTSQLGPLFTREGGNLQAFAQPEDYLASKANETGLPLEEIKSAINVWVSGVQGPYRKGLAALYAKRFGDASQLFKQSISASERDLFASYLGLANAEVPQGHYGDAEAAVRKALAINPQYPAALDILGWALTNQDRFTEAESVLKVALNTDEKTFGKESPAVAPHLGCIGVLYGMTGRFTEAQSALERALAIIDAAHDRDDMTIEPYLNDLAEVLRVQGKYLQAGSEAERALSIASRRAGPASLEVTGPLSELGLIYKDTGLYAKAIDMLERAQTIDEKELGPSHPAVARGLLNLATAHIGERNYSDAEPLLKRSLTISQQDGQGDTLLTAGSLYNLGYIYDEQGRYSDARVLLEHALVIAQERLGPENFRVAIVDMQLGIVSFDEKKFGDAEKFLRKAAAMDEKILGPDNPNTASAHIWLGYLYFSQGLYAAAQSEYLLAYNAQVKNFGPTHPQVAKTASNIAAALRREGREDEAAQYDNVAAKARKGSGNELPADKPDRR